MVGIFASWRWFRKLEVILQLGLQLDSQLQNWILKLRNGTRVPRRCFTAVKIFATWRMNLRKLALVISQVGSQLRNGLLNMRNGTCVPKRCFAAAKIFASWPHFRKLKFQLKKCSQVEKIALFFSFYSSLWRPSNSFEIPSYFDHSKSLSYIKIK